MQKNFSLGWIHVLNILKSYFFFAFFLGNFTIKMVVLAHASAFFHMFSLFSSRFGVITPDQVSDYEDVEELDTINQQFDVGNRTSFYIFPLDLPLRLLERPEGARAKASQVHHASAEHRPRLGPGVPPVLIQFFSTILRNRWLGDLQKALHQFGFVGRVFQWTMV